MFTWQVGRDRGVYLAAVLDGYYQIDTSPFLPVVLPLSYPSQSCCPLPSQVVYLNTLKKAGRSYVRYFEVCTDIPSLPLGLCV